MVCFLMKKVLVAYASMSGNTEEVAEIIISELQSKDIKVDAHYIDVMSVTEKININEYSSIFLGTYTWDLGYAPDEISNFAEAHFLKEKTIHSFGTGETQFGEELYCIASDKIAKYYNSPSPVLKVEQSPRGSQETEVRQWVTDIIDGGLI